MAVARKPDLVYPITSEWRERVLAMLEKDGRGAHARLAKAIGCSPANLTELLSNESKHSKYVAKIHEYYKWPPPAPPIMSQDIEEIRYLLDEMGDAGRDFFRELKDMDSKDRKSAIQAMRQMLALIRTNRTE